MFTLRTIRLTGLLRKKPWKRGFFYGPDSPATRQARPAAGLRRSPWNRSARVEGLPLQSLDRFAADIAVQVASAGTGFETGERRLVRGPSGHDDEAATAGSSRGAERDRLGGAADNDPRGHAALELDLVVEEHRPLRVGLGRRVADELERLAEEVEQQLAALVLENRPQLHEIGDQPAQTGAGRQPPVGERHRHARPFVCNPELAADCPRSAAVEHVRVDVGFVAVGREEPGLDRPLAAHALDPPAALGKPDVTEASTEKTALSLVLGDNAERAAALVDDVGVDAFAVVGADELVAPASERRQPEATKGGLPRLQEVRVRGSDPELNSAAVASSGVDRRVGVRHQLGMICERSIPACAKFSRK